MLSQGRQPVYIPKYTMTFSAGEKRSTRMQPVLSRDRED